MKIIYGLTFCICLGIAQIASANSHPVINQPDNDVINQPGGGSVSVDNPLGDADINGLLASVLEVVVIFAIPVVVFFIIYAGFLYVTARGNVDQISRAHKALLYAVIGGVIVLGASVLIDVISGTVNEFKANP